jgi:acetolactate synthase-1/2/3 large subunit
MGPLSLSRERTRCDAVSTIADALADAIADRAGDRVFAFPGGGTNLNVIEALADRGVDVVLARSEGGAAFMASAYADLIGKPVALLVGLGPGVANVVNGMAHALLDQSPLLLVGDRFSADELGTSGHQVLDQRAVLAPVTKWQETLTASNAVAVVGRALDVAAEHPAGPVFLEFPRDADADAEPAEAREQRVDAVHDALPVAALAALAAARRPVLLVGDEAADCPQTELIAVAEQLTAPVLSTYKGKGVFPEDHALWCGIVTNAAIEGALLAEADILLALGVDPVELLPRAWTVAAPVLALRAHDEPAPGYRPRWAAIGSVTVLARGLGRLEESASEWTAAEVSERREALFAKLQIASPGSLGAVEVIESVLAEAPPETTVTVDAGAHMFAATWFWRATLPRRFLISNGLATMGYAVPAAVAAALARPGEPVIAFTGDGGFLLHGSELETAVRLNAKVIVVVLNDASLSLIRIKQEDLRFRRLGVDFSPARLADVGRALGADGVKTADAAGLRSAVREALARAGSTVIEVELTGGEYRALQHAIRGGGGGECAQA